MEVHLVIVDVGDTEPEITAFRRLQDAQAFEDARGDRAYTWTVGVLSPPEALRAIRAEIDLR